LISCCGCLQYLSNSIESHTYFCQEGNAAISLSDRKSVFLKVLSAASALPRLLSTNAAADVMNN